VRIFLDSLWSVITIIMLWTAWTATLAAVRLGRGASPARRWTSRISLGIGPAPCGGQRRGCEPRRGRDRRTIHRPAAVSPTLHPPTKNRL